MNVSRVRRRPELGSQLLSNALGRHREPSFRTPDQVFQAPPAGFEPATRRLEVVGRGSTRVRWCLRHVPDQGVCYGKTRALEGELRPQLRPRTWSCRPVARRDAYVVPVARKGAITGGSFSGAADQSA